MAAEPPSHRARVAPRRVTIAAGVATGLLAITLGMFDGDRPAASAATAAWAATNAAAFTGAAAIPSPELASFLDRWCLGCHSGADAEAGFDLAAEWRRLGGEAGDSPDADADADADVDALTRARLLREVRRRLADGSMPPSRRRPSDEAYRLALGHTDAVLAELAMRARAEGTDLGTEAGLRAAAAAGMRNAPVRRLTRMEYAAAVRDLLGVDFDPADLPADEVGHGFDTNAGTLSLPPARLEASLDAAERIAAAAFVDAGRPRQRWRRPAAELEHRGGSHRREPDVLYLYSGGAGVARFDVPVPGRYRLTAAVAGQQAGPDLVRMQLRTEDNRVLIESEVPGRWEPMRIETTLELPEGPLTVGATFVNDFYDRTIEDPELRDRNAAVSWIELEGPLVPAEPTPLQRDLARRFGSEPAGTRWRVAIAHLAERAWRGPVSDGDAASLAAAVEAALGDGPPPAEASDADATAADPASLIDVARLRLGTVAILMHPRFLFRVEADPAAGEPRELAGHELAARLSLLLWSSVPDEELAADAAAGRLASRVGRRRTVDRMLEDPRSLALAEHFAAQWLRIRALEIRRPDAERFPGVDAELREAMRMETVLFLDAMLREHRPISELLSARESFLNEPLARHYGIAGVRGPHMRRVAVEEVRHQVPGMAADEGGLGVLRHASILLTTSNPTRTSPVMRGKWVLEALLDDPPPPAPPVVPALPRGGEATEHDSLRQMLERHREDPACAACHRRMDPLGFALEPFDAVGRPRYRAEGVPVDASAELPDGTRFDGPAGLRDLLLGARRPDFIRSLLRHLSMYALGRGLDPIDDAWIEPALAELGEDPTLREMLLAVIESPPFLHRFPARPGDDA